MKPTTNELVRKAWRVGTVVPAFNIPALPMMEPVVRALRDTKTFGLVQVARLEWMKFEAGSMAAIRDEYERVKDERFTRLHLDHVPVIDEDGKRVDYAADIAEAIALGFESVMVDGSRLPLRENIAAAAEVAGMAHAAGIAVEAELGAVFGHEAGPLPPYEELFASGKGFTDPAEAAAFVGQTGVDWLSVAIGNLHGAISQAARLTKKVEARLDIEQLDILGGATGVPLVLHGGTGIKKECLTQAFAHGIAKINIGTGIRQAFYAGRDKSLAEGIANVYQSVVHLVTEELEIAGSAQKLGLSG